MGLNTSQKLGSTPIRMGIVAFVATILILSIGAVAISALLTTKKIAVQAERNNSQADRATDITINLLQADAAATNAFLVPGQPTPQQQNAYDNAISTVRSTLTDAAAAQPADREALSTISVDLERYTTYVEHGRTNNRLGSAVGAEYQRQASNQLRESLLPVSRAILDANNQRTDAELETHDSVEWMNGWGVLGIILLIGCAWWLAHMTHRVINFPLTAAILLCTTIIIGTQTAVVFAGNTLDDVRSGTQGELKSLSQVQMSGNEARSLEALTLISRGPGAEMEKRWGVLDDVIRTELLAAGRAHDHLNTSSYSADHHNYSTVTPVEIQRLWTEYATTHRQVRSVDDEGKWDDAVRLATTPYEGATAAFDAFDDATSAQRQTLASSSQVSLKSAATGHVAASIVVAAVTLVAAALCVTGFASRIQEYL